MLADLVFQVDGEAGVRFGDGLVLADEAAQLAVDGFVAVLQHRVVEGRHGVDGERLDANGEQPREEPGPKEATDHVFDPAAARAASMRGRNSVFQTSMVIGAMCL